MDQYLLIPFFSGMNIHLPAIFGVHQGYRVLTHPQLESDSSQEIITQMKEENKTLRSLDPLPLTSANRAIS